MIPSFGKIKSSKTEGTKLNQILSYLNAAKFLVTSTPSHFIFFVTGRCNLKCAHCFYWKETDSANIAGELSIKEIEKISKSIGHIKLLSLTGGEPFLRNDVEEIAKIFLSNNNIHHLVVHTNGVLTDRIRRFSENIMGKHSDLSLAVSVSIDGLNNTHDTIRSETGVYKKVKETIGSLQHLRQKFKNFEVEVTTVISELNIGEAKELSVQLDKDNMVDAHSIEIVRGDTRSKRAMPVKPELFHELIEWRKKNMYKPKKSNYPLSSFRNVIDELTPEIEVETMKRKKMVLPCKAGKRVVVLTECGELLACELLDKTFGSVRENGYDIKKMLFSEKGKELKKFIRKSKCYCTWGCAVSNNIIFNLRAYPKILSRFIKI